MIRVSVYNNCYAQIFRNFFMRRDCQMKLPEKAGIEPYLWSHFPAPAGSAMKFSTALYASLLLAASSFCSVAANDSAIRYGELMTQHWMIADLAQQIERANFYQTNRFAAELNRLEQSILETEERLEQARTLYKRIHKKEVENHSDALSELLNAVAASDSGNENDAEALLNRIGRHTAGKKFQATPIRQEEIEPAWDAKKLIGKNFQPKRIIFGSTGQAADNRTLALRFDFGNAGVSFCIPMKAPGELDLAKGFVDRTDSIFPWMQQHRVGWHYWAGVYNNQNTCLAPWFLKEHEKDDDIWMRLIDGKIPSRGGFAQVNIWNRDVQNYLQNYCAAQGRTLRNDPFLVCYDYTAEPHPFGSQPPGQPQYAGYNDSAIAAFREFLQKKFKTLDALNSAWHGSYKNFSEIQPPPDPYVTPREKASPLSYEFEKFRVETTTRVWKMCYDGYRKNDPAKPVAANMSMYMSGWPCEALDAYGLQKNAADWIDMHMNNFPPNLPEQIYLYSLCRLTGKVPVQFEYVWTFPRTGPLDDNSESDFRTTCTASIWRNLVWGKKVFVFFDFYYDWPAYHNAFLDRDVEFSILRPSGCVVPAMKRKALRFNDLFINTEVATPPIVVLQPTASVWNSPALHPNQSFSFHIGVAQHEVHDLLFPKNYPFLYVPEEAVLDDGYDLKKHKVIILPQAPYLPPAMSEKLLAWVKNGGTLIALGVPGIWNEYGQDDLRLVTKVFGKTEVRDEKPGHWQWSWNLLEKNPETRPVFNGEKLLGAMTRFGKGKVVVSTDGFKPPSLEKVFYAELDRAIGRQPFDCATNFFELVLREDKHGQKFLFALNPHTREVREDQITVAGKFARSVDLGIGSGVPVPVSVANGETHFVLRLQPGEGTVIALKN